MTVRDEDITPQTVGAQLLSDLFSDDPIGNIGRTLGAIGSRVRKEGSKQLAVKRSEAFGGDPAEIVEAAGETVIEPPEEGSDHG